MICLPLILAVSALATPLTILLSVLLGLAVLIVGVAAARRGRRPSRATEFCGLRLNRHDLHCGTMIVGEVGSGKTSKGLVPAIEATLSRTDGLEVGGGLVLEHAKHVAPTIEALATASGRPLIRVSPGVGSSGVCFNLIDRAAPAAQVAANLWSLASPHNPDESPCHRVLAQDFLCACVEVVRQANPEREITVKDLLGAMLSPVSLRATAEGFPAGTEGRNALDSGRLTPDEDFRAEVVEQMKNAFAHFVVDPVLAAQFCAPSSFSFRECSTRGAIVLLHVDPRYYMVADVVGKALLQQFLSESAMRVTDASCEPRPSLLLVMDEAERYLSGHRDEAAAFATSRNRRLIVLASLVSEAWLTAAVGRAASDILLGQFCNWVWFANRHEATRNRARTMLGSKAPDLESLALGESVACCSCAGAMD